MSNNPLPVRSPLDVLRLDFPHHQITLQNVGDKLFFVAEASDRHVQPSFAQAVTAGRLRARLHPPIREFTVAEPSIARVYDVLLGGKDNFAVDQEQAQKLFRIFPRAAELARESREFQRRAVTYAAGAGVRQFIDIGCGLPTTPNTHETARGIQPGAIVVYVDHDEQVLCHAQNILAKAEGVFAVAGDISHPDEILYDWRVRQAVDFCQPVCLVMTMILHFHDARQAGEIVAQFIDGVPYGSFVILSVGQLEGEAGQRFSREYTAGRLYHHTRKDMASFVNGLKLVDPGITEARNWRAPVFAAKHFWPGHIWATVARKGGRLP